MTSFETVAQTMPEASGHPPCTDRVYDNMKVVVILKPDGKQQTDSLTRMCTFYGFNFRFSNACAGWEEELKNKVLCEALADRLCHKSYLINMTGTSYRIKETKKLTKKI